MRTLFLVVVFEAYINCLAVPPMDLKEDPEERKEQIYAILDDPSQNRVEMYDKWCKYYDQVISSKQDEKTIRFCSPVGSWTLIPKYFMKQAMASRSIPISLEFFICCVTK